MAAIDTEKYMRVENLLIRKEMGRIVWFLILLVFSVMLLQASSLQITLTISVYMQYTLTVSLGFCVRCTIECFLFVEGSKFHDFSVICEKYNF